MAVNFTIANHSHMHYHPRHQIEQNEVARE